MTQADAEDGYGWAQRADKVDGDARVARDARTRRNDDEIRRNVTDPVDGDGVVADDRYVGAQLAQVLVQVVGKAVVVIDQQHARRAHATTSSFTADGARPSMRSASATADNTALALLSVSWYSVGGSESATMPAPAWIWATPSLRTRVRIVMAVSRSPSRLKKPMAPPYGPRWSDSSSAMISIARILGAPVSVPAGKQARSASIGRMPACNWPSTLETICMTCE